MSGWTARCAVHPDTQNHYLLSTTPPRICRASSNLSKAKNESPSENSFGDLFWAERLSAGLDKVGYLGAIALHAWQERVRRVGGFVLGLLAQDDGRLSDQAH